MRLRRGPGFILLVLAIAPLVCAPSAAGQAEDLSVLGGWIQWANAANLLQLRLNSDATQLLDRRVIRIQSLNSPDAWRARQAEVKNVLQKIVGPFPKKSPLNAVILGTVIKEGYTIEKVVFESLPKFYVTGCLFIPAQRGAKLPAILNVIGHTDIAFRAPSYQQLILNLVRKGFIVFAVDPVGQGERLQYYDAAQRRSLVGGATTEHSYFGRQCFLAGSSAARYFAWDGIRAIDYLVSRPEVDPERIGVTGISGGGTQTSYIAALDARVAAAAPANYIAGFRRLLESIGPQDAEQNLNEGLMHGIDHADFLEVRAPRPTLVVSTTRDFFSIQGTRETYGEARVAFRALSAEENLSMVEDDHGHGYTKKTREAIYQFFQKHLNNPGSPSDESMDALPVADITVTRTGQLSDSLGGETVFSLNRLEADRQAGRLEKSRRELRTHLDRVKSDARRISGYEAPVGLPNPVFRGRLARPGYSVELYALLGSDAAPLPVLLFLPDAGSNHRALIYLNPQGKAAAAAPGGEMEQLLRQGYAVLAPDLAGIGEQGRVSDSIAFIGVLTGRSVTGYRAAEIVRCVRLLKSRVDINGSDIGALARGSLAIPLLHAAAFDDSIQRIGLIEPLLSYQLIVTNRYYTLEAGALVGNVLTAYDLPDLAATLAPRKLLMIDIVDHLQKPAAVDLVESSLDVARRSYAQSGASANLSLQTSQPGRQMADVLTPWLK